MNRWSVKDVGSTFSYDPHVGGLVTHYRFSCYDMRMWVSFWIFHLVLFDGVVTIFDSEYPFAKLVSTTPIMHFVRFFADFLAI